MNVPVFCKHRPDSNWSNPWSCHRYISCKSSVPTVRPCTLSNFVYDPYIDACVPNSIYSCREIKGNNYLLTFLREKLYLNFIHLPMLVLLVKLYMKICNIIIIFLDSKELITNELP